jgi:hypothetical protein
MRIANTQENTRMAYLQRALQALLTILLSLTAVILVAFGISESLRLAGVERGDNILITFLVSVGLLLLVLWLLPHPLLTLKEGAEQGYIQRVLQSLAFTWVTIAGLLIVSMGLYLALGRLGVERNQNLLITFLVSVALLLLVLWFLPRPLLILREK